MRTSFYPPDSNEYEKKTIIYILLFQFFLTLLQALMFVSPTVSLLWMLSLSTIVHDIEKNTSATFVTRWYAYFFIFKLYANLQALCAFACRDVDWSLYFFPLDKAD